jgi:uncharacterized repeat protein (TIGR04138 family)
MSQISFSEVIEEMRAKDPRYGKGAYYFVRSALDYTLKDLKQSQKLSESNHVSGQQLLEGIRKFALDQFGPLAYTVFDYWGIHESQAFGDIVFNLIEVGVLGKNDKDDIADFSVGFDFNEALIKPFEPEGKSLDSIWKAR